MDYNILLEAFDKIEDKTLHNLRIKLDPVIYGILDDKYGKIYDDFWLNSLIQTTTNKTIFITERRKHPNLKFVLRNAHYYCPDWNITIHCSKHNYEYIKEICKPHEPTIVQVFEDEGTREQGIKEYNEHLKKLSTWESIDAEFILTIETDSYLRKKIPIEILDYDYCASIYTWCTTLQGGGLSLRKKSVMTDICMKFSPDSFEMQDIFAVYGTQLCEYNILKDHSYFIESCEPRDNTVGVHQWWTFIYTKNDLIYKQDLIELLLTCDLYND
jgi:hypothetical protein